MIDPYCGSAPVPAEWLSRWNLDFTLLASIAVMAGLHLSTLWREAAYGRGQRLRAAVTAWTLIAVLFISPLCALTSALFSARVAHHVVLVALIAPLLVMSLPSTWRLTAIAHLGAFAFVAHMVVLWLWHAPAPYGAALADSRIFWVMELSLLFSAMWLWMSQMAPAAPLGSALGLMLGTVIQMGALGAIITFARVPLYAAHVSVTEPWGLSALQDQQLAGLIMWVPGAIPYLAAALTLLAGRIQLNVADETSR